MRRKVCTPARACVFHVDAVLSVAFARLLSFQAFFDLLKLIKNEKSKTVEQRPSDSDGERPGCFAQCRKRCTVQ